MKKVLCILIVLAFVFSQPVLADLIFDSGESTLNMDTNENITTKNDAILNVTGGNHINFTLENASILNYYNGNTEISVSGYDSSYASIKEGSINTISIRNSARIDVYGGNINERIIMSGGNSIHLFGGNISGYATGYGGYLYAYGDTLSIERKGSYDFLVGTLQDGTDIDLWLRDLDLSNVVLIPEPTVLFILGLGGIFVRQTRK